MNEERDPYAMGLETPFIFGKHKGRTLLRVLESDIGYITWAITNRVIELSNEAYEQYTRKVD
jgi:hypothetical protein